MAEEIFMELWKVGDSLDKNIGYLLSMGNTMGDTTKCLNKCLSNQYSTYQMQSYGKGE